MKSFLVAFAFTLSLSTSAFPQHSGHKPDDKTAKPAQLVSGMGSHHHPVSTTNVEAQKFFDQGLAFVYAFNHDEAIRSFRRAAEFDPKLAMAHWGIALALGPNINLDVDPEREKAAYDAVHKALSLATGISENERAYIDALVRRYSIDPQTDLKKLALDYKLAMADLVRRYPDDLDAATLYAESAMNLRPWKFWTADGKPAEGTEEIVATLESVLRRDPNHFGAIHYYIHAVEASSNPERALAYAPRLPSLIPAAGHLVHMPAHIYARTGDYEAAALSNKDAARVDEGYMKVEGSGRLYPAMYYSHNLHFLAIAESMSGRFGGAMSAARQLEAHVGPHLKAMPMLEGFMTVSPLLLVRFNRWDDIEKLPAPDKSLLGTTAVWHFARGIAFNARGRTKDATAELDALIATQKLVPADATFSLNRASHVLQIAQKVLQARLAERSDRKQAIEHLRSAVELEDAMAYDEPQAWFLPVREMLGAALMRDGNYAGAEQVFRSDLEKNRRNGRSLYGLTEALKAQQRSHDAMLVKRQFDAAWKNADTKLTLDLL
jgi:tetratricopeptide (TPR) repeat protein